MDIRCVVSWAKGNPTPEDIERLADDIAKLDTKTLRPIRKLAGGVMGRGKKQVTPADAERRGKQGTKALTEWRRRKQERLLHQNGITVAVRHANEGREQ
jgi:hypothetical protein